MSNNTITYRVVGRYMRGTELEGYHFIGSDNKPLQLNKERTIYMIGKGLIENMRVQTVDDKMIIRGKGVNLNLLPVYDTNKQDFRHNGTTQTIQNNSKERLSQFTIIKRIMNKNNCIGYVTRDAAGNLGKYSRSQIIQLGADRRLSNASVQRYMKPGDTEPTLVLRGEGVNLKQLPVLIVDEYGRLVDPHANKAEIAIRAARMRHSGEVTFIPSKAKRAFECGDYIIVTADGKMNVIKGVEFNQHYIADKERRTATCDYYLDNVKNYTVEIYGSPIMNLNPDMVKGWTIAKLA